MKNIYKYIIVYSLLLIISCSGGGSGGSDELSYQYHTPEEVNIFLEEIAENYPLIAKVEYVGTSESGREINALIISDSPGTLEGEPAVRLTGGIHGNEMMSVELLIRFIEYLTYGYSRDPEIKDLVDSRYICIIPVLNPDGLARKRRYNDNNIDLNRNFNSTGASLQKETEAIQTFSASKQFCLSITYHTGAVLVNMPFDYKSKLIHGIFPIENNLVNSFALTYTDGSGSMFLTNPDVYNYIYNSDYGDYVYLNKGTINGGDWYVALGTLQDWSYTQTGCLDLTIEVVKKNPANETDVQQIYMYNRDSIIAYIKRAEEGIYGRVTDSEGTPISNVEISVSWNDGGTVTGDLLIKTDIAGYYNRILLEGTYNITFAKDGYTSQTKDKTITTSERSLLNIQLTPL